jgi:microcystin-dependent protein
MFGGVFAPVGWVLCQGQMLPISNNEALYSLLGTIYGGDGVQTFGIPDLRGRAPVHQGTLQAGGTYIIGQLAGQESVSLLTSQMPSHGHTYSVSSGTAAASSPAGNMLGASTIALYVPNEAPDVSFSPAAISASNGGNQPHENMQPFLCLNFIMATSGIYPSQN